MKKLFLSILIATSFATTTALAASSSSWRIIVTDSIANDTPVLMSEVELLGQAEYTIDSVTTGLGGSFTFEDAGVGDVTDHFAADDTFTVSESTGNDGTYTVASSVYSSGVTTVTVAADETVASSTADGKVITDENVDITRGDLGITLCGWTRQVPNLTGNTTPVAVGCDTVRVNQQADSSISIPAGTSRIRLGNRLFDNNNTTQFQSARKIDSDNQFMVIYKFYQGASAIPRLIPDVEQVSIVVPVDYVGPGDEGYAPSNFTIEYQKNDGSWATVKEVQAANFNDGTDITLGSEVIAKKLTFTVD